MRHKYAAQLYTLRDALKKDFTGVLRELKKMGWAGVQISGLHGYDPKEVAAILKETGLGTAGMHVGLERLQNELPDVLQEANKFQTNDIVCPALPAEMRNENGYREVRKTLNAIADKVAPQGFRISYHNHAFEFETTVDGQSALAYLLEPSDGNRVMAEIDVFWVKKGGQDPLSFISHYPHRMPIIHLKDMTNDKRQTFGEVGTGLIDFVPILTWCELHGVAWYAVEQDVCPGDPMDSLQISLDNLHRLADLLQI